jgi:hypothetical protein
MKKTLSGRRFAAAAAAVVLILAVVFAGVFTADASTSHYVKKVSRKSPSAATLTVKKGSTMRFKASCKATKRGSKYRKLVYKSSNSKVLSVSKSGRAKARKNGTARVKAVNPYSKKSTSWKVKVYSSKQTMYMTASNSLFNISVSDLDVSSSLKDELAGVVKSCGGAEAAFQGQSYVVKVGSDSYRLTYNDGKITNQKNGSAITASDLKQLKLDQGIVKFGNTENFRRVLAIVKDNAQDYRSRTRSHVYVTLNGKKLKVTGITFDRGHVQFTTEGTRYDASFDRTKQGRTSMTVSYMSGKAKSFTNTDLGKALVACGLFGEKE